MVFLCLIVPKTFESMVYMRKINRIVNIGLICMVIGGLVCQNLYALRVPIGQKYPYVRKVMTKLGEVNIELVSPDQYAEYAELLREIAEESKFPNNEPFLSIVRNLREASLHPQKSKILVLFVATDLSGEILGIRMLLKSDYMEDLKLKSICGRDVVREKYRNKGIGASLRKAVFEWMIEKKYKNYLAIIEENNRASYENLMKLCRELGLSVQFISQPLDDRVFGLKYFCLIDLTNPYHKKTKIELPILLKEKRTFL